MKIRGGVIGVLNNLSRTSGVWGINDVYRYYDVWPRGFIQFIGAKTFALDGLGTNGTYNIGFGENIPLMKEGDLVVVYFSASTVTEGLSVTPGYTTIGTLYANDTFPTRLTAAYKFMGSTPDTGFSTTSSTAPGNSLGVAYMIFRGVNTTSTLATTPTPVTNINSGFLTPPSISNTSSKAVIVSGGASATASANNTYTSSDFDQFFSSGINVSGYKTTIGIGYRTSFVGNFSPARFGFSQSYSDSTSASSAGISLVLNSR